MQRELRDSNTRLPIEILGINAAGQESANDLATQGRVIPWLQDTAEANVWGAWAVTWRDVVILDENNRTVAVFNLTQHGLQRQAARDSLRQLLLQAAE
jgi:hypothetical protein